MSNLNFKTLAILAVTAALGALAGNLRGDQLTLMKCATKGQANLAGGGAITCAVVKEAQ